MIEAEDPVWSAPHDAGIAELARSLSASLELVAASVGARAVVLALDATFLNDLDMDEVAQSYLRVFCNATSGAAEPGSLPDLQPGDGPGICRHGMAEDLPALEDMLTRGLALDLQARAGPGDADPAPQGGLVEAFDQARLCPLGQGAQDQTPDQATDHPPAQAALRGLRLRNGEFAGGLAVSLGDSPPQDALLLIDKLAGTLECLLEAWTSRAELERDLAASRKRSLRLQRISEVDPLTGLENISTFEGKVRLRLETLKTPGAFILVDLDHFKTVNDMYGHQFGDLYLKTVARAIQETAGTRSVAGRIGGDEFAIFTDLPHMGESYLRSFMAMCRSTIQRASAVLSKPELGRVSIGAAIFPDRGEDYETLYHKADLALYASKESGRGTSTIYDEDVAERFDYAQLAKTFQAACRAGQVVPYFQPMVSLDGGEIHAFEVLCRWENPRHGILSPSNFASIFTDHSLATLLTRHMIQSSLKHFTRVRHTLSTPVKLSLNLTYFDLMDREFVFDFQAALSDFGVDWTSVMIEVQETVVMGEPSGQVFRSLQELRRRGAEVALDDFGTGYGGLRHLKSWPVDVVKIDKSFIRDLCTDYRDRAIVSSIVRLAKELGFRVVAEGIETRDQAIRLREMGCDLGQGFIYGRPAGPQGIGSLLIAE